MTLKEFAKGFINILFPLKCALCKKPLPAANEPGVCAACLGLIRPNPRPNCKICGRPVTSGRGPCAECRKARFRFSRSYSACLYEGAVKELIHLFKYGGKLSLSRLLSKIMVDFIKADGAILAGIGLVTCVPLQGGGLNRRGFNQSGILASAVSKEFGIPYADILRKAAPTRMQNELSREERLINLKGAFRLKKGAAPLRGERVLLVDDVMTTGATLNECAKVLIASGASEVRCLTLARGA